MIGAEVNRIVYKGDGITTSFPYTFTVLEKADIVVTLVDKESKKKTLTSDYFIDMDKKEITYPGYAPGEEPAEAERPPVLPAGWYLVIQRKTKIDQQTSLGDKWPFDVTEDALDKITRILQDLDTDSKRHLKVSVEASGIDPMLPSPKANMGFYWDETGTKLVEGLNPNAASESAAASSAAAARSAAAASASAKSSAYHMEFAQRWAVSSVSPDDNVDSESTTGMTQSSKTWALYAKAKAAESAERADATIGADEEAETYAQDAKTYMAAAKKAAADATTQAAAASASEKAAQTSENSAAASASAAKASENAARESEKNADSRAQDAESAANGAKGYAASALADKTAAESAANTAKAWSMSDSSPDGVSGNKSAKTWAEIAASRANDVASSASASASSASDASTSASNAKISETNAANSATSAAESAEKAKAYIATTYSKAEVDAKIPTKTSRLTNDSGYITNADISLEISAAKAEVRADIPTKVSQLTNDAGYITKADITEGSTPDLTPYMKKIADSDLSMGSYRLIFPGAKVSSEPVNSAPMLVIDTTRGSRGVNIKGPNVLVNGVPIATETDLSDKLDKTGTAAVATKATQDGAGNVIATTYIKTVNNLKPDTSGNVNLSGGAGGNITVDSALSSTSTNAIQNRVVQQEFASVRATIPTKVSQLTNDSGYLTQHQSLDGYVKTVNNTAPDSNGNVTIALSGGGGVSTSESNTWTGKQTFQKMKFNFEGYNAPRISGATDNPSSSVAVYNVQGNFTLDMSTLAGLLSNGDATLFTAYITSNGAYTLSIVNAGTLKYVGSASDLAITTNGMILNIMLIKSSSDDLSTVVQASALS